MENQFSNETFGGVEVKTGMQEEIKVNTGMQEGVKINTEFSLPAKVSMWTKVKNFLFQEIKVELTPKQQQFENKLNDFLHQEVTWEKVHNFLFQEISFKKNK